MVRIAVLGPLVVTVDDRPAEITQPMLRRLLSLLVTQPGVPFDVATLADQLWLGRPPPNARKTMAVYVHRLRRILGSDDLIGFEPAGYTIDPSAAWLDTVEFERAVQAAGEPDASARDTLAEGLALWRGQPFQGMHDVTALEHAAQRLAEMRAGLIEQLFGLELALGKHADITAAVKEAIAEYPYRENLHAHLMLALYRSGRRAEALEAYRDMYRLLKSDLGVEPMPELRTLHLRILNTDSSLARPAMRVERVEPAQLPAGIVDFTGRSGPLSEMDDWAAGPARSAPLLLCGGAGLGKTALAIHWGSRYVAATGAGHLYINLRGHSSDPPLRPIDVLSYFLRSLGTAPERIPVDPVEASALFRSTIANRHLLVVLDNAASAEQVRDLMPGGARNLVIVTSREKLSTLVARQSAQRINLGLFSETEAVDLLGRIAGAGNVDRERDAATDLARLCGHLPLALRVAAANLADGRYASLGALVADISDTSWPAPFDLDDDAEAGPKVAFDHSYSRLDPQHQKLFRLLSVIPGPDFTVTAVESFSGNDIRETGRALRRLAGAHLIEQHVPGRFSLHDLVHRYARSVSESTDPPEVRDLARQGLYRYYLRSCDAAAQAAYPAVLRLPWTDDRPGPHESFDGHAEAMGWLDVERPNLIAATAAAFESGDAATASHLADMTRGFYSIRRLLSDGLIVSDIATRAAEQSGDLAAGVAAGLNASMLQWALGDYDAATSILMANEELARRAGWVDAAVTSLVNLGGIYGEWGRLAEAADCLEQALRLQPADGRLAATASLLTNLGAMSSDLGRLDASIEYATAALRIFNQEGIELGAARALQNLGLALRLKGDVAAALPHLNAALSRLEGLGDPHLEASALVNLALIRLEQGDLAAARTEALRAKATAEQSGSQVVAANALTVLALLDRDRQRHEEAIAILVECKATRDEYEARFYLATTLLALGEPDEAQAICEDVTSVCHDAGYRYGQAVAMATLAEIHHLRQRRELARTTATEALELMAETGITRYTARLREILT